VTQTNWQDRWRSAQLTWSPAFRVIPTRFPAVNLFDRVASADDFEALYALEALTNDRLRTETGDLDLVPREERRFGPGYGPIMAALTHLNPQGSRFSDGTYGVFYCARSRETAIAETRYHSGLFLAATSATYGMPMVVELGIALDVLVGAIILGVFFFQIREQFDSLDIHHLEKLKDD